MRCLDIYNHTPEFDGKLLVNVLMLSIIASPLIMAGLIYYKRKRRILAFHKEASPTEFFDYSQLNIFPDRR